MDKISNFQHGLLMSPKCKGCGLKCEVVYDAHHDQYFSLSCGKVIMEMGVFVVDYDDDLDRIFALYNERWAKKR